TEHRKVPRPGLSHHSSSCLIRPARRLLRRCAQLMLRFNTLDQMLTVTARRQPHHLAVVEDQRALTYEELDRVTARIAANLRRVGVGKGDRVALLLSNALEFATCYFGILKAGG